MGKNKAFSSRALDLVKPLALTLTLLMPLLSASSLYGQQKISLNTDWHFKLDDDSEYSSSRFDDSSWRTLDVPHDWSIEGKYDTSNPSGPMGGYMPCGTAWYRKTFTLDPTNAGKRFFVRFDGVYMKSQVWINDRMVGEYPNGYNSFEYDITPFVRFDAPNLLAVRVDNSLQPGSRWYSGSGIYRNVNLLVKDQLHFVDDATFITTPEVSPESATVNIDFEVICNNYPETRFFWTDNTSLFVWTRDENDPDANNKKTSGNNNRVSKECEILSVIYDQDGNEVARCQSKRTIGDYSRTRITQQLHLGKPHLWSPDTPALYRVVSTIGYEGTVRDSIVNPLGIRNITFSPEYGMKVNGKVTKVQGVCLHQNASCFGSAVPPDVWKYRLVKLKEMGCNAIRTHYPLIPEFYDYCDSLGFLVSKEILDEWNRGQEWGYSESSYGKLPYTYHLYFEAWHEIDQRRMVRRDRNHPCVFLYQLGNEIPNQRIEGIDLAKELKRITHEEDPTRPVTAACDFFVGANIYGFMDVMDIAGYNYIDRIHKDSLYQAEHARYPDRVLLGTETYHTMRNHVSIKNTPSCIGEFIWVGYDYLGEIVWPHFRGWASGILDVAGFPKPEFYQRKSYWSEEPVVHVAVDTKTLPQFDWNPHDADDHWNWECRGDSILNVCVFSNCDEVDLVLNGRSLGRKSLGADEYCAEWQTRFRKGSIKAIGYRGGRKVAEHQLKTASKPAGMVVSRMFKGPEVTVAEIDIVDKNGIRVPDFSGKIEVSAPAGAVLGLDNGSQYDPEAIKYTTTESINASKGRFVVYVRTNQLGSSIHITAPALAGIDL